MSTVVFDAYTLATGYKTPGGTSLGFLKADGTVDLTTYEPFFTKNTAFNKNFGTTAGTVAEGNHTHTFASLTSTPTTLAGYGITDFNSLGDARWSLTSHNHSGTYDNYVSWNLKTNGVQRIAVTSGGTLDIVAGTNMSATYSAGGVVTLASTDTNTWIANSQANAGYVAAGGTNYNMVWATDGAGNPGWGSIPATAGATATHAQGTASATWTFNHNTGQLYPAVTVYGSTGLVIIPKSIQASTVNTLILTFNTAITGTAVAVVGGAGTQGIQGIEGPAGPSYTHPAYTALNPTLSGALVLASLTTDAIGSVTAATTRTLTLANLGYTGATDANNYVHPSHTGEVTGSGALTIASNVVDIDNLAAELKATTALGNVSGTVNINWALGVQYNLNMTAATTLTFSNMMQGKTITLIVTGNFTLTLPTSVKGDITGFDGTKTNQIQLYCFDSTTPQCSVGILNW